MSVHWNYSFNGSLSSRSSHISVVPHSNKRLRKKIIKKEIKKICVCLRWRSTCRWHWVMSPNQVWLPDTAVVIVTLTISLFLLQNQLKVLLEIRDIFFLGMVRILNKSALIPWVYNIRRLRKKQKQRRWSDISQATSWLQDKKCGANGISDLVDKMEKYPTQTQQPSTLPPCTQTKINNFGSSCSYLTHIFHDESN